MPRDHDLVDIEGLHFCMETKGGAYGVKKDLGDDEIIFLPVSLTELTRSTISGSTCDVTIPEWLAVEKGLV